MTVSVVRTRYLIVSNVRLFQEQKYIKLCGKLTNWQLHIWKV